MIYGFLVDLPLRWTHSPSSVCRSSVEDKSLNTFSSQLGGSISSTVSALWIWRRFLMTTKCRWQVRECVLLNHSRRNDSVFVLSTAFPSGDKQMSLGDRQQQWGRTCLCDDMCVCVCVYELVVSRHECLFEVWSVCECLQLTIKASPLPPRWETRGCEPEMIRSHRKT